MRHTILILAVWFAILPAVALAQRTSASKFFDRPPEWFAGEEARAIAGNILSHQSSAGGWPKNTDTVTARFAGDPARIESSFDNSATTDELRFLARVITATGDRPATDAFLRGLDYILSARLPVGGWPQRSPPPHDYGRYITFNDGCTVRLMFFCREVARDDALYGFVDPARRQAAREAWEAGIEMILRAQIRVDGTLTAWCAQHDPNDFTPRPGRSFEPASISGCETIGIVRALMSVESPKPEVVQAVDAAVAWLESVKIEGIRVEDRPQEGTPRGYERFVVNDPDAPPMWARFYEIGTNRPIFCDRDGIVRYDLADIGVERRTGYQWLKYWPKNLLESEYPRWKANLRAAGHH
jgi:PelA/Pel-15E family pectate lyase